MYFTKLILPTIGYQLFEGGHQIGQKQMIGPSSSDQPTVNKLHTT